MDVCTDMRVDMCEISCVRMCVVTCEEMSGDVRMDMCMGMRIDPCSRVYRCVYMCGHLCIDRYGHSLIVDPLAQTLSSLAKARTHARAHGRTDARELTGVLYVSVTVSSVGLQLVLVALSSGACGSMSSACCQ